mmetsp:Transcript_3415/g.6737  ORF Transcript_3415/g.6737 Transcript_3415/m.6737 type:complete len:172 (-) Transcript_3415:1320-1835(-)
MTEVREFLTNQLNGSCKSIPPNAVFRHDHQYGLFASKSYEEGDIIFEESPLVILSPSLTTSSLESSEKIKRQFLKSSFASSNKEAKKTKATGKDDEEKVHSTQSSLLRDLIIPSATKSQLAYEAQIHKLRGMLLAAASYAVLDQNRKSEDGNAILTTETKQKIFELYHPHK